MNPDFLTRPIDSPRLGNQFLEDTALQSILARMVPESILNEWKPDLTRFGGRVLGDILQWGRQSEHNPPQLQQYNAWGERVDNIEVSDGWKNLQKMAAEHICTNKNNIFIHLPETEKQPYELVEYVHMQPDKEGLISIAYERKFAHLSRILQFVKLYLFHPSSGVFDCPLAMTDGAARCIELHKTQWPQAQFFYNHLVSRDPAQFWTSGQWMTEKNGGSDISNSETIAKPTQEKDEYLLYGYKFFTSAITSDMALTLARIEESEGKYPTGSRGLSCFVIRTRKDDNSNSLNNIRVHKLKNKLGTRAVPTAELELHGSKATLIGKANRGVPAISTMLNITRAHNAVCSVAVQRRAIAIARDYASRRKVFGKLLSENSLHLATLSALEVEFRGNLQFALETVRILGLSETGQTTPEEETLLRLLTPLVKLYTAKHAISIVSECIECLGGTGYMEDSDLPRLLRDSQVGSIWEGTTNVLSHDIWRPIKTQNGFTIFVDVVEKRLAPLQTHSDSTLRVAGKYVQEALKALERFAPTAFVSDAKLGEAISRQIAFSLARVFVASLLLHHAGWSHSETDVEVARRYSMEQPLVSLTQAHEKYRDLSSQIAMDMDEKKNPRGVGDIGPDQLPRSRY